MVLGVCRRVLQNEADAADAFQATFLVLVRKADSVVPRQHVGPWLYGVAYNTALKAKWLITKRRARERQMPEMPEPAAPSRDDSDELRQLPDQEIWRLPETFRAPVVLCDLQGMSYKDAARQLGLTRGALSVRLTRARAMLVKRFARLGVPVSLGLLSLTLNPQAASASVAGALVASTVHAAGQFAATPAAPGGVSPHVVALTESVVKAMLISQVRFVATTTAVVMGFALVAGGVLYQALAGEPESKQNDAANAPRTKSTADAKDNELKKLEGTWVAVSVETSGTKPSAEEVQQAGIRLMIAGEQFKLKSNRGGNGAMKGTLVLDSSRKPATMDFKATRSVTDDATDAGSRDLSDIFGIYRLEGDTLTFCYAPERPKEFATSSDRKLDQRLYVFRKQKPE